MTLFKNKFRIESARLPGWDYSKPGYYFITICTHDRGNLFGTINNGVMKCNEYGNIVHDEWRITGEKHSHIALDGFVVMPNHMHGIIRIVRRVSPNVCIDVTNCRDVMHNVSTNPPVTNPHETQPPATQPPVIKTTATKTAVTVNHKMSAISPVSGSLSVILRSFKSAITKRINELRKTAGAQVLQSRFHDHIIRNEQELLRIRQYIKNNPINWEKDRLNDNITINAVQELHAHYEFEEWMV